MPARSMVVIVGVVLAAAIATPVAAGTAGPPQATPACAFPVTVTDATGTPVRVSSDPTRVVTLNPSAAQLMWAIGGKDKVVGVSQYAGYLPGADSRVNVSGAGNAYVDVETVVNLTPDLVLAPNTIPPDTVQALRRASLTVYRYRAATSLRDIENQTRLTGQLTGECTGAAHTTQQFHDRLATIRRAVRGTDRPRVLYSFFGYTAGRGTFIDRIITTAGGDNVAADAGIIGYQRISPETIIAQDPQWLIRNDEQPTVPDTKAYASTTAVKTGQVVVLDRNLISQPGPRVIGPITKLAKALHPNAYAAATQSASTAPGAHPTTATTGGAIQLTVDHPPTTRQPADTGTTTATTPGFDLLVGFLGLLAGLAIITHRSHR